MPAPTSIPIAADESVDEPRKDAERAVEAGACRLADGEALEGRRHRPRRDAIAERAPVYLSSALDGPVGIAAAAHAAAGAPCAGAASGLAHGLATQRLFAATIASVECELRDGLLTCPRARASGSRSTRRRSRRHRL